MSLAAKMHLAFGAILVLMAISGGFAYSGFNRAAAALTAVNTAADDFRRVGEFRTLAKSMQDMATDYMAVGNPENRGQFAEMKQRIGEALRNHLAGAADDRERALWTAVEENLAGLTGAAEKILAMADPVANPNGPALMEVLDATAAKTLESIGAVEKLQDDRTEATRAQAEATMRRAKDAVAGGVAVAVILGLLTALTTSRGVAGPVNAVTAMARRLADGDLTVEELRVKSRDEVGQMAAAFNRMVADLREMMARIRETSGNLARSSREMAAAADQAAGATSQIAATIQQVAEGAGQQAAGAGVTVGAMADLRQAIDRIGAGSRKQAESVHKTSQVMEQMAQAIDDVARAATHDAAERVRQLGEHSRQIGEIVQLISEIADQTNLLALNAAIEAARAGEHGKGFAVVADEVRKLAERSSRATQEIGGLVANIQRGVQGSIDAMAAGTREVEAGAELAGSAGAALDEILTAMERTNQKAQGISAAAEEVAAGTSEVLRAVNEVSAVTEENTAAAAGMTAAGEQVARSVQQVAAVSEETAASAQEVSAAAEEVNAATEEISGTARALHDMSENLEGLVKRFRL